MELLRGHLTGTHLLHMLTVLAPMATVIIVSGMISAKTAMKLLGLGVLLTLGTVGLATVATSTSVPHLEVGAPLPLARAALEAKLFDRILTATLLPANLLGDLVFWCSTSVIIGSVIRWILVNALHIGRPQPRRRSPRRRLPVVALREPHPWRRELELPARV
ncbi:MAG: hypothetical protein AAF721_16755 [Myxococcota bacterium]